MIQEIPSLTLSAKLFAPAVYLWKRGDELLYIGVSSYLIGRLGTHTVINVVDAVQPQDEILVWCFDTEIEAKRFEGGLLAKYETKYNFVGKKRYRAAHQLRETMTKLRDRGMTYRDIAAATGFQKSTVWKVMTNRGKNSCVRGGYTPKHDPRKRESRRRIRPNESSNMVTEKAA